MQQNEGPHMQAGRELDMLVARVVMGWQWSMNSGAFYPPGLPPMANTIGHDVPKFSTDIAAAWQVVAKMRGQNGDVEIGSFTDAYRTGWWWCMIYLWSNEARNERVNTGQEAVESSTAPLAICLAALKAVSYKEVQS